MKKTKNQKAIDKEIGHLLQEHREALDLTLSQVVGKLGIGTSQLHNYEHGKGTIPLDRLIKIAGIYGVPVGDILEPAIGTVKNPLTPQQWRVALLLPKLTPTALKHVAGVIRTMAGKK
ncbi:MAG: helix-turn-helix transcriptional regulator [Parvularculales bacterium]